MDALELQSVNEFGFKLFLVSKLVSFLTPNAKCQKKYFQYGMFRIRANIVYQNEMNEVREDIFFSIKMSI